MRCFVTNQIVGSFLYLSNKRNYNLKAQATEKFIHGPDLWLDNEPGEPGLRPHSSSRKKVRVMTQKSTNM